MLLVLVGNAVKMLLEINPSRIEMLHEIKLAEKVYMTLLTKPYISNAAVHNFPKTRNGKS